MKIALKADNGKFIRAAGQGDIGRDIGNLFADRDEPGSDETFIVHEMEDGRIALQTLGNPEEGRPGRFFCAEGGGGGDLVANRASTDDETAPGQLRTAIGPW